MFTSIYRKTVHLSGRLPISFDIHVLGKEIVLRHHTEFKDGVCMLDAASHDVTDLFRRQPVDQPFVYTFITGETIEVPYDAVEAALVAVEKKQ